MRLTEGAKSSLAEEVASVLRVRLKATALVLVGGLSLFLIRVLTLPDPHLVWLRVLVVVAAVACFWRLRGRQQLSLPQLRAIELLLLGVFGVQTAALQVAGMQAAGLQSDPVEATATMMFAFLTWAIGMLVYGIFIPNTWQRAAQILIPAAVVPLAITLALWGTDDAVRTFVSIEWLTASTLMTAIAAVAGLWGTYAVNSLRTAAFRARKFGQYQLRERLGSGGMGEVFLADHQLLKRPSAIKIIRPGYDTDAQALARFEQEVQATAKLSHWNTVEIFDYGRTDDGTFYYVMEYLPGMSLHELVERHGPMPSARVIHFLQQTCAALAEAHAAGLIHRDIKPANIFAAERGGLYDVAKLLDFGLVVAMAGRGAAAMEQGSVSDGAITGSPLFISPEQAAGSTEPDVRSDIYSLGATAYYLLTGQPPFVGSKVSQVIRAHLEAPVVPPRQLRSEVSADLEAVVLACLAKKPEGRFAEVSQLETALVACGCAGRWTQHDAAEWWRRSVENESG